jgi:prevent-host-death family protein
MATTVNIHSAKTHLSGLLKRVQAGEEIVIAKSGKPIARIVPIAEPPKPRVPGGAKGLMTMSDDFDAPLPDDLLEEFYNGRIQ